MWQQCYLNAWFGASKTVKGRPHKVLIKLIHMKNARTRYEKKKCNREKITIQFFIYFFIFYVLSSTSVTLHVPALLVVGVSLRSNGPEDVTEGSPKKLPP